jgi:plasmid stabilization system protein ParE
LKLVNIVAEAEVEFREAASWYRDRDPRVAERFIAEARRTLHLIETFPQIGSRVPAIPDPAVGGFRSTPFPIT